MTERIYLEVRIRFRRADAHRPPRNVFEDLLHLIKSRASDVGAGRPVVLQQRRPVANVIGRKASPSREDCVVVDAVVRVPDQRRGRVLPEMGHDVPRVADFRDPEVLAWIRRALDRRVGPTAVACIVVEREMIHLAHDDAVAHHLRHVAVDASTDLRRIRADEPERAQSHRIELP